MKMSRVYWKLYFKILVALIFMVLTFTGVALGDSDSYKIQDTPTNLGDGFNHVRDTHVVGSPFTIYIFATGANGKNVDPTINTTATATLSQDNITQIYTVNIVNGIGTQDIVCPTVGTWSFTFIDDYDNSLKHRSQFDITLLPTIEVRPDKTRINVNETTQFRAWLVGDNNETDITNSAVWSSSVTGVATVGTGSTSGLVRGISAGGSGIWLTSGVSNITAMAYGLSAPAVLITVVQPILTITSATPTTIFSDDSLQLKAVYSDAYTPTPLDVTNKIPLSVLWISGTPSVASVSSTGLVRTTLLSGDPQITATYLGTSGTITITVIVPTIEITTAKMSINVGETNQFYAWLVYPNHRDPITSSAVWSSSVTRFATIGTGSTAGLAQGIAGGPSNITATVHGVSATVALNVVLPTLSITPVKPTIFIGGSKQFQAVYYDAYTTNPNDVTASAVWSSSSSNPSLDSIISATGLATVGSSSGVSTITATYKVTHGTTEINVVVPRIEITPVTPAISVGDSKPFTVKLVYLNYNEDYLGNVVWSSSKPEFAEIGTGGLVQGMAAGMSSISATATALGISSFMDLTVTTKNISPGWGPNWRQEVLPS